MAAHVTSPRASLVVFVVLLVLLVATVAASEIEHAVLGLAVALAIAGTKAVLIIVYFMNIRFADSVTRMASAAGFIGLSILLVLALADYVTRSPVGDGIGAPLQRGIDRGESTVSHAD